MLRTYKYRLSPTTRQIKSLNRTLEICRILYNSCLADAWGEAVHQGPSLNQEAATVRARSSQTGMF
ncbi:MAG TPA: helix-turn-helix domain-containing protein [Nitrospirota bacterium]|nr:helix-turn-helix domain-containing protein [Nitrospirota bacterium]